MFLFNLLGLVLTSTNVANDCALKSAVETDLQTMNTTIGKTEAVGVLVCVFVW